MKIKYLPIFLLVLSCAGSKKNEAPPVEAAPPVHLAAGKKLLANGKFEEALAEFNSVLKNQTTTPEVPYALYYSGVAYQELNRCQEASERFRKFASGMNSQDPELVPQAFYRLGLCYEVFKDKGGAIAAYLDALNRLPGVKIPLKAELQARLAGLYAQMGNQQDAQTLYDSAEKDLMFLRRQHSNNTIPLWLAETLYNMGKVATKPLAQEDYEGSIRSFEKAQVWLLKVARFNDKKWSEAAAQEIIHLYNDAWKMIEDVPLIEDSDKILALKDQQDKKINMSVSLFNMLTQLKRERGYDFSAENKYEKSVFEGLSDLEAQLELILKSRPVEQSLTPAALAREGLKREGKLVDPDQKPKKKRKK
jgi:tetratricopeptide (TPR) repeat protein